MNRIEAISEKYRKRHAESGRLFYPPGGADVQELANIATRLLAIVRELQHGQAADGQNETERKLWGML